MNQLDLFPIEERAPTPPEAVVDTLPEPEEEEWVSPIFRRGSEAELAEGDFRLGKHCMYALYLTQHIGTNRAPSNGFAEESKFFGEHKTDLLRFRKAFFPFQRRAGQKMKTLGQMSSEELSASLRFYSPKAFGSSLARAWREESKGNSKITWNFKKQSTSIARDLEIAGANYYRFLLQEGTPIPGFTNYRVTVTHDGISYKTKLPELRPNMRIDHPSLWTYETPSAIPLGGPFHESPMITMRILAYALLAYHSSREDNFLPMKWEIPATEVRQWKNGPTRSIQYRLKSMLSGKEMITTRDHDDVDALKREGSEMLEQIVRGYFPPNHKACGACPLNTVGADGEALCDKRKRGVKPNVPLEYFDPDVFTITTENHEYGFSLEGRIETLGKVPRHVARMMVEVQEDQGRVFATSFYACLAHGLGYEERMLKAADALLQEVANSCGKPITYDVPFVDDFKYAGQKAIAGELLRAGFEQGGPKKAPTFTKIYKPTPAASPQP